MKDKHLWFGYLQAGDKSSLVVQDSRVESGDKRSIYLYNHLRKEMVEYRRDIIEPKLREAKADEFNADELSNAYLEALRRARPNLYRILFAPGSRAPSTKKASTTRDAVSAAEENDIHEDIEISDDLYPDDEMEDEDQEDVNND